MRHLCAVALLIPALFSARGAQDAATEVSFELREGLIWIQVSCSRSTEPLNFLIDSGAGASVMNQSTAEHLGFTLGNPVTVRGVSTNLTGYKLKGVFACAGGIPLPSDYVAVDLSALSRSCERSVDGLVGADFFREQSIQLDFKEQRLRIVKSDRRASSAEVLPLQVRPCGMRVPINVNGKKRQWVRLDTGCATPLQWVTSRVHSEDCNPKIAIGLTELAIPQTQTVVEIGNHRFENVATGLHEQPIFAGEAGLLGNGLLSRFSRVTIDAKSRRLILEP